MPESRKHKRFTVMCKAELINTEVQILDINKEGMRIQSKYSIKLQKNVSFCIILPDLDIINITGDILWEKELDTKDYSYGVKIKVLSEEHESIFKTFLAELKTEVGNCII